MKIFFFHFSQNALLKEEIEVQFLPIQMNQSQANKHGNIYSNLLQAHHVFKRKNFEKENDKISF